MLRAKCIKIGKEINCKDNIIIFFFLINYKYIIVTLINIKKEFEKK